MKTLIIILLIYIFSIFLNRFLNKIIYKKYEGYIDIMLWFIPIVSTFGFLIIMFHEIVNNENSKIVNWFKGNHWKHNGK